MGERLYCTPQYEHEVVRRHHGNANIGRIVEVRSTEQSVGVILHGNHLSGDPSVDDHKEGGFRPEVVNSRQTENLKKHRGKEWNVKM